MPDIDDALNSLHAGDGVLSRDGYGPGFSDDSTDGPETTSNDNTLHEGGSPLDGLDDAPAPTPGLQDLDDTTPAVVGRNEPVNVDAQIMDASMLGSAVVSPLMFRTLSQVTGLDTPTPMSGRSQSETTDAANEKWEQIAAQIDLCRQDAVTFIDTLANLVTPALKMYVQPQATSMLAALAGRYMAPDTMAADQMLAQAAETISGLFPADSLLGGEGSADTSSTENKKATTDSGGLSPSTTGSGEAVAPGLDGQPLGAAPTSLSGSSPATTGGAAPMTAASATPGAASFTPTTQTSAAGTPGLVTGGVPLGAPAAAGSGSGARSILGGLSSALGGGPLGAAGGPALSSSSGGTGISRDDFREALMSAKERIEAERAAERASRSGSSSSGSRPEMKAPDMRASTAGVHTVPTSPTAVNTGSGTPNMSAPSNLDPSALKGQTVAGAPIDPSQVSGRAPEATTNLSGTHSGSGAGQSGARGGMGGGMMPMGGMMGAMGNAARGSGGGAGGSNQQMETPETYSLADMSSDLLPGSATGGTIRPGQTLTDDDYARAAQNPSHSPNAARRAGLFDV